MSNLDEILTLTLKKANDKLKAAKIDLENNLYDDSASRSYYAVYHFISAILLTKELSFSSHNQTLGAFNKEFVHQGIFPKNFTKMIYQLFSARETGDYDIRSDINKEKAVQYLDNASIIVAEIHKYLTDQGFIK
ncbi:MAG: HEPN domain-containing protein [Leptospiraceae bacterium]|nr:HEPN domain-containing protein [Leptospiraceae bacterium]